MMDRILIRARDFGLQEKNKILPEALLNQFENREVMLLDSECQSAEALALHFLFDVFRVPGFILDVYLDRKRIQKILIYLERQLGSTEGGQFARILRTMKMFMKEKGMENIPLLSI